MSLPLTIRKNIRDSEPRLKESLERIAQATGKEWSFEVDWAAVVSQINPSYKDNIGSSYQGDTMGYVADNIEKLCKDEMSKEAFNEATSESKIVIRCAPKIKNYWEFVFQNGTLVLQHLPDMANQYQVANINLVAIIPTPGLPLASRLNIEKSREQLDSNLEKLAEVTGQSDWQIDVDFEKILPQLEDKTLQNSIGNLYYNDMLSPVVDNITKVCKNETSKEAFLEATQQKKIVFRVNDKIRNYNEMKFENGALVVEHKKSIANIYQLGNFNLEDVIPSPGGLPLVSRLNLEKSREHLDKNLERLSEITGQSDWQVDVDFEKILPLLPQHYQTRIGSLYYEEILTPVVDNLEKLVKKETSKEAFLEATQQHKIIIRCNDKIKNYNEIKFENGALVVEHKKDIANLYQLGSFKLGEVIPSPGGLPLVSRLDLEENRHHMEEHLEQIKEITGSGDWSYEVDFEKVLPQLQQHYKDHIGSLYYKEVLEYIVQCLRKTLANEITKEAFNEATSQRKIVVRMNDKIKSYWEIKFEDGTLVIEHKKDIANIYQLGSYNLEAIIPVPGVLSLVARLNIQDNRPALEETLERIKQATGEEYSFDDSCLEVIYQKVGEHYKSHIGSTFLKEVMEYLASNLEKSLKDDMVKEAFNEVATAHQITLKPDTNPKRSDYWDISFQNGVVVVGFKADIANIYHLGNINIEKLL